MATPPWFNESYYLDSKLAQLKSAGYTEYTEREQVKQAIEATGLSTYDHYQQYSLAEKTSASEHFNTYEYLQAKTAQLNAEPGNETEWTIDTVAEAFQSAGFSTAWDHYTIHGTQEGLNASNDFDTSSYLEAKVAQLQQEQPEGEWTVPKVVEAFQAAGLNPVSHYLLHGEQENIPVTPAPEEERVESDPLGEGGGEPAPFTVVNDNGEIHFVNATGEITFTLEGSVATFSSGEETDSVNTVDFAANPTLKLGEGQTLNAPPEVLQGATVDGGGQGSYHGTLEQPLTAADHAPALRNLETVSLQSTMAAAGLLLTNATEIGSVVNAGSTHDLTVQNVGESVYIAAQNVNAEQNPLDEGRWTNDSNFVVRYRDTEAAPDGQQVTLEDANLNLLSVTALGQDESGEAVATSAGITNLVIQSNGVGHNSIRSFDEGAAGLGATVENVTIEGTQPVTIVNLPENVRTVDASEATGDQHLVYNGANAIEMKGGSGNDILLGGSGNDQIDGGAGNDVLFGRGGADTFTGGEGDDTFVIETDAVSAEAADIVLDFGNGADQLNFQPENDSTWFSKAAAVAESFDQALAAANAALETGEGDVRVNAQQVGDDLWVFGDTDGNGEADALVQLTGVALENFTEAHVHGA